MAGSPISGPIGLGSSLHPPDVKKMPLGKLSKQQIARGFEALEALEEAMKNPTGDGPSLEELSSCFYTVIPHNFGRSRPPPINSPDLLQAKKDMLLVRADWPRGCQADWAKMPGPEGEAAVGRLRAKGGESQTERWGRDGTGRWGVCHTGEAGGGSGSPSGRRSPVPVILGSSGHRAGPDPAGSPW